MLKETYTLNNGVAIPKLGLGTWFIDDDKIADAVREAVKIGYRHIDTAQAYGNERGVGEGVRTCGIPREELFVVSKVAAEHKTYEEAKAGIDGTLEKMGLDYLDMMIIHSPQPWVKVNQSDDRYVEGNRAAWRALEEAYKEGKLKAIGGQVWCDCSTALHQIYYPARNNFTAKDGQSRAYEEQYRGRFRDKCRGYGGS